MVSSNPHFEATTLQKISALLIPCFAYVAVLGIPITFTGIIDTFSVSTATATIATTTEISCIALASLFVSLALSYFNPRSAFILGVLFAGLGQLGTILSPDFTTAVISRGIAGLGEGLCIGIGFASLAQIAGGTRLLGYSAGISAAVTLTAFLVVPKAHDQIGPLAIFWMLLIGYAALLPLAFKLPSKKIEKLAAEITGSALNLRGVCFFVLCLLSSMGANTLWLYFEQAGENAHLDFAQIGMVGSVSMLGCIFVPAAANFIFSKVQNIVPLVVVCLCMAVTSHLFVVPNSTVFVCVAITMSFLYVFLLAYARMYSSSFDSSGRTTAAASGADTLGMVVGPMIVAVTLNLDTDFSPLGDYGILMQILCIIPATILIARKSNKGALPSI
ncbi:MFS transporter [Pseudomonas sp. BGr12]|uniref:MFS transporter n=1 Tax=Pseudomonas sp. BGr12 TaxID=2936269 RepID=UPI002559D32B|nr:MFS transporter [Pseudomonas sp. BJa5]MDL2428417.1 MFS transporter [Pseudomonas sp. BJa5]